MEQPGLVLRGALVIDGTGAPARRADVALRDGMIAGFDAAAAGDGAAVVELDGLALAPGFIDVHTHDDRLLLSDPTMTPKLSQGVTTVVTGNCGVSLAPLGDRAAVPPLNLVAADAAELPSQRFNSFRDYFAALEAQPPAINCAALVGHTTLRVTAMSALDRPASRREIAAMQAGVAEALAAGAIGVSTGTYYAPANAATADEIRQVFEPLRGTTALIASHIRDEGERVLDSMAEAMEVAGSLGVRQVLSHHKVIGRANFGRSRETLALLDEARRTRDVCLDCYPYTAASTVLRRDAVALSDRVLIAWSKARPAAAGRYLDELAAADGLPVDAMIDALQPAGAIYFYMDEADVERILAYPRDDDRIRRPAARRVSASAAVGRVPARARALRAAAPPVFAGRGGAPDDRAAGRPLSPRRARPHRARRRGGPRRVRSRPHRRRRHVLAAEDTRRRHPLGVRQRDAGVARGPRHRRAPRPRAPSRALNQPLNVAR